MQPEANYEPRWFQGANPLCRNPRPGSYTRPAQASSGAVSPREVNQSHVSLKNLYSNPKLFINSTTASESETQLDVQTNTTEGDNTGPQEASGKGSSSECSRHWH